MNKNQYLLGFRQYLHSEHSYNDLSKILQQALSHLNSGYAFMIALCGDDPRPFLREKNLFDEVRLYDYAKLRLSPIQLVKRFAADNGPDDRVKIIYYSKYPEGLTYPIELFTLISSFMNYQHLGISDSDFQIPFSEVIRAFNYHIQNSRAKQPSVTFPQRDQRQLDAENYPINRRAMEDIENLYVYFLSNIRFLDLKLDFQSGVLFTNRLANIALDFNTVGKWVGTLHLTISLLRQKEVWVDQLAVSTNIQHESTINFDVQCAKIDELYDYYLIPMENIIRIALDHPRKYLMSDWCDSLSTEEIDAILQNIYEAYVGHKQKKFAQI